MKRLIVWILICSILVLFCSCGNQKLNGTYSDNMGFSSFEFNGEKVVLTTLVSTTTGTYKMEGDTVTINYDDGNSDTLTYDEESDTLSWYGELIYSKENASNSVLTTTNENSENEDAEEPESIGKSEENLSSWEFYEENDTIPTPDSSVKGIFFT